MDKSDTYFSWTRKHFFASKIVLQVFVCCLRGVGSMSSSRVVRSFHGTVLFGSPLAFLRVVKICFRYNLFLEASQWACFVVASFSRPYFFGSSFRQLSYIQLQLFPSSFHEAHTGQNNMAKGALTKIENKSEEQQPSTPKGGFRSICMRKTPFATQVTPAWFSTQILVNSKIFKLSFNLSHLRAQIVWSVMN